MARRKKEEPFVHRQAIANAAHDLFSKKGIENTSMNEIAKLSGYSKATLYVYFKDKEQLVLYLVLKSMQHLFEIIEKRITDKQKSLHERFMSVANALYDYQQQFPFYFALTLIENRIEYNTDNYTDDEKECSLVGEKINQLIYEYLAEGKAAGIFKDDLKNFSTVFSIWAMVSGAINLAAHKKNYIEISSDDSIQAFLDYSFNLIYQSLLK